MWKEVFSYKKLNKYDNPRYVTWCCLTCGMIMQRCAWCGRMICDCNTEEIIGEYEMGVSCKECRDTVDERREKRVKEIEQNKLDAELHEA